MLQRRSLGCYGIFWLSDKRCGRLSRFFAWVAAIRGVLRGLGEFWAEASIWRFVRVDAIEGGIVIRSNDGTVNLLCVRTTDYVEL